MTNYVHETPVFRPTKEEFAKPFSEYIGKVLKKNPDVAMFKVVPPEGWRPRRAPFPKLQKLDINCPIKQLVFGTRGSYRCMLVEQKPLTAYEFRDIAEEEARLPPNKERDKEDKLLERAFWSSVTINPPLYGADTPMSLFDEKLSYGWNLRDLGCLLKQPHIPQVPGVTTPMTYFGMWKSFFAWHVEDADLFSINYLHMGAPKVWYCVSPKDRGKFERMCASMFPELHSHCSAFMRHKDILLSPATLKNYGVEYMQAKQEPNEFIVLNAGAYHAGYNLGFNCAEAVNFATQEWVEVGRNVVRCKCDALNDGVRLSMRLFGCSSGSSASSDEEESESEDEEDDSSSDEEGSDEEEAPQSEEADSGSNRGRRRGSGAAVKGSRRRSSSSGAAEAETGRRSSKRSAAAAAAADARESKRARTEKGAAAAATAADAAARKGPRQTKTSMAAAAAASKMRRTHATAEARARLAVQHDRAAKRGGSKPGSSGVKKASTAAVRKAKPARVINKADTLAESLQRAAAAAAAMRARAEAAAAAAGDSSEQDVQSEQLIHDEEEQQQHVQHEQEQHLELEQHHSPCCNLQHPAAAAAAAVAGFKHEQHVLDLSGHAEAATAAAAAAAAAAAMTPIHEPPAAAAPAAPGVLTRRRSSSGTNVAAAAAAAAPDSPRASRAKLQSGGQLAAAAAAAGVAAAAAAGGPPPGEAPQVIIGEDRGNKHFYMVQVLSDAKPKQRGLLVMRWLKEGRDGLFRPSADTWEEAPGALVGVRTQWVPGCSGKPGGYRLLTLRSRILDTELVD